VIFCGDLNDEPLAATTQIIQGPGGSEIDFRRDRASEPATVATATLCGTSTVSCHPMARPTAAHTEDAALIDHVFASHRLVNPDNIPAVEIVAASPLPSMTDDPTPQTSAPTDHAAIVATFSLSLGALPRDRRRRSEHDLLGGGCRPRDQGVKEPGDFSCHSSSLPGRSPDFPTTSEAQARGMEGSNDFRACPDSKKVQLEIVDLPRVKINEA
jgi:hypothetical protein